MKFRADQIVFFASALVLLLGYVFIVRPFEARIAEQYAQLDDDRLRLEARLASTRRAAVLRSERSALDAALAATGIRSSRTVQMQEFLRLIATAARRDHVTITSIVAGSSPPLRLSTGTPGTSQLPPVRLDELPLSVSMHAGYRDVLQFVQDLDRQTLVVRVGLDTLESVRDDAHDPELRATLRVALLHEAETMKGRIHGDG
jgi:Tfp pilus assembly protein PilO